jgi:S-DNA-T family DNA segregation ATPase FtsK/SpoIIIE
MRRYGLQPIATIDPSEPMPDIAIVVIGRWVWRYRSELAPFGLALATAAAAWWLHGHDAHWWPVIASLAAASAPVLAVAGGRIGLANLAERIYASTVAASASAWLAAATAAGPAQRPLPLLILIGTLVLAVPWWTHRRRRARIRVERKLAAWPEIAQAVGLAGSRVLSALDERFQGV